jgi:hypothetical protein
MVETLHKLYNLAHQVEGYLMKCSDLRELFFSFIKMVKFR